MLQQCLPTPFKRETFAAKSSTIRLFSVSNISSVEVVLEPAQHARWRKNINLKISIEWSWKVHNTLASMKNYLHFTRHKFMDHLKYLTPTSLWSNWKLISLKTNTYRVLFATFVFWSVWFDIFQKNPYLDYFPTTPSCIQKDYLCKTNGVSSKFRSHTQTTKFEEHLT